MCICTVNIKQILTNSERNSGKIFTAAKLVPETATQSLKIKDMHKRTSPPDTNFFFNSGVIHFLYWKILFHNFFLNTGRQTVLPDTLVVTSFTGVFNEKQHLT